MVSIQGDEYLSERWEKETETPLRLVDYTTDKPRTAPRRRKAARRAPKFERRLFSLTLVAVAAFFLFSGATSIFNLASGFASASQLGGVPTRTITVQPGDTLWQIAGRYGDPNTYILDRVEAVAHLNHLSDDASLVPGEQIKVPVNR